MKKVIMVLCLMFISSQVLCADYIYTGDNPLKIRSLPNKWTFANGNKTGNFRLISMPVLIMEGWKEITVDNSAIVNPDFQTAGNWIISVLADHAEKTRIITNKTLNQTLKVKGRLIRAEGKAILNAKYDDDFEDGYDADKAILKNYYKNTIVPLIMGASTVQEIIDINNGDEYNWPTL